MVEGFSRHWTDLGSADDPPGQTTLTLLWQRALGLPGGADRSSPTQPNLEESDGIQR